MQAYASPGSVWNLHPGQLSPTRTHDRCGDGPKKKLNSGHGRRVLNEHRVPADASQKIASAEVAAGFWRPDCLGPARKKRHSGTSALQRRRCTELNLQYTAACEACLICKGVGFLVCMAFVENLLEWKPLVS